MIRWRPSRFVPVSLLSVASVVAGCSHAEKCDFMGDIRPLPLGTHVDPWFQAQESNAEAIDFVVREHEWMGNSALLTEAGKDHVKQIAARANQQVFPILIEPSSKSVRADATYQFPVSNDSELDASRRAMLVEALQMLGVPDADSRVVVAPDMVPGYETYDVTRAISNGLNGGGGSGGGNGGFGGSGGGR